MAKEREKDSFDSLLSDFRTVHSKKMNALMITADNEEFARNYFKIMEYIAPKLQRTEIIDENTKDREIVIVHKFDDDVEFD